MHTVYRKCLLQQAETVSTQAGSVLQAAGFSFTALL